MKKTVAIFIIHMMTVQAVLGGNLFQTESANRLNAQGDVFPSQKLIDEFHVLRRRVSGLQPDFPVTDPPFLSKDYGSYVMMWNLEEKEESARNYHEVIRLFILSTETHSSFSVTYYKTRGIVKGTLVLRRFIGPEPHGWRNDTIDYKMGEYMGFQGTSHFKVPEHVTTILENWNITPFL